MLPYVVLGGLALAIGELAPRLGLAALVLAVSPAELAAPALARALGGRTETAAAVLTGTLVVSLALLVATLGATQAGAAISTAIFAFVVGAAIAGAVPQVRDALLPVTRAAAYVALAILIASAVVNGVSAMGLNVALAALAFVVAGAVATTLAVGVFGGDGRALYLGGGTRDFAVAATLAAGAGADTSLPLAYGAELFGAAGLVLAAPLLRKLLVPRKA